MFARPSWYHHETLRQDIAALEKQIDLKEETSLEGQTASSFFFPEIIFNVPSFSNKTKQENQKIIITKKTDLSKGLLQIGCSHLTVRACPPLDSSSV